MSGNVAPATMLGSGYGGLEERESGARESRDGEKILIFKKGKMSVVFLMAGYEIFRGMFVFLF